MSRFSHRSHNNNYSTDIFLSLWHIYIRNDTGLWFIRNMFKVIECEVRISNSLTRLKNTVRANPRTSVSAVSYLLSCLETFLQFACCWQRLTVDLSRSSVFIPLLPRAAKYFSQRDTVIGSISLEKLTDAYHNIHTII